MIGCVADVCVDWCRSRTGPLGPGVFFPSPPPPHPRPSSSLLTHPPPPPPIPLAAAVETATNCGFPWGQFNIMAATASGECFHKKCTKQFYSGWCGPSDERQEILLVPCVTSSASHRGIIKLGHKYPRIGKPQPVIGGGRRHAEQRRLNFFTLMCCVCACVCVYVCARACARACV